MNNFLKIAKENINALWDIVNSIATDHVRNLDVRTTTVGFKEINATDIYNKDLDISYLSIGEIESYDVIFSELLLHMIYPTVIPNLLSRYWDLLNKKGHLLLTCLGSRSIAVLNASAINADLRVHDCVMRRILPCISYQKLFSALYASGFVNPVVSSDIITIYFDCIRDLLIQFREVGCMLEPYANIELLQKCNSQFFEIFEEEYRRMTNATKGEHMYIKLELFSVIAKKD